jgi:tRNA 2-thiouridine synthesizing protein A
MVIMKADGRLDVAALARPLADLRARKALDAMETGEVLLIMSASPGTVEDMESFTGRVGHEIVGADEADGRTNLYIRKG